MQLFYTPDILTDTHILNSDESKHCIKVLRKKAGDKIQLADGKGNFYSAIIVDGNPKKCTLKIEHVEQLDCDINYNLHLAVAPTKNNERFEWFLEKATEIGITTITPIVCQRSERKVLKLDRMKSILVNAMKQSNRAYLPKLNSLITFEDFISKNYSKNSFIAHCEGDKKPHLKTIMTINEDITILIGPEGDFSSEEIKKAEQQGFNSISLGNSRLRTETAAIVACHTINLLNQ
ncbi:MAG: 16S rRNA (uracil(1498)-N(3))-methyltransferase [Flavobacteriales bacterium]